MRLSSKVDKLERQAKVTLRCDWCRFVLRDMLPDETKHLKDNPALYIKKACPWCGTEVTNILENRSQWERDITLLMVEDTCNGERFRDVRLFAAAEWLVANRQLPVWVKLASLSPDKLSEAIEARHKKSVEARQERIADKTKLDKYALQRAELKTRAERFYERMRKEEEKKYGPYSFPLAAEMEALLTILPENHPAGKYRMKLPETVMRKAFYYASVVMKAELAIWGKTRRSVREAVEKFAPQIDAFDAEHAEEKRKKEEEEAQRKAEYEARRNSYQTQPSSYTAPAPRQAPHQDFIDTVSKMFPDEDEKPKEIEMVVIPSEMEAKNKNGRPALLRLPDGYDPTKYDPTKQSVKPTLPPDDGTVAYQQKLAHYKRTGVWLPDNLPPTSFSW